MRQVSECYQGVSKTDMNIKDVAAFSRNILDELTCNSCGKKKATTYTHVGVGLKYKKEVVRPVDGKFDTKVDDNEFYEISPTVHLCGICLNAARAAAKP